MLRLVVPGIVLLFFCLGCSSESTTTEIRQEIDTTSTVDEVVEEEVSTLPDPVYSPEGDVLVGEWNFETMEMPGWIEAIEQMATQYGEGINVEREVEQAKAEMKAGVEHMKENGKLFLHADGTMLITMYNPQQKKGVDQEGRWTLSDDHQTFTMNIDGIETVTQVMTLTPKAFAFGAESNGIAMRMVWKR